MLQKILDNNSRKLYYIILTLSILFWFLIINEVVTFDNYKSMEMITRLILVILLIILVIQFFWFHRFFKIEMRKLSVISITLSLFLWFNLSLLLLCIFTLLNFISNPKILISSEIIQLSFLQLIISLMLTSVISLISIFRHFLKKNLILFDSDSILLDRFIYNFIYMIFPLWMNFFWLVIIYAGAMI